MTEPNRQSEENEERIIEIEIERLRPFKEHPFQVNDPEQFSHDGISSYEDGIVVCSSVSWRDKLH